VLETQRLLVALGYPLGTLPLGGLGPRTRGAIEYFQRKYGLPVTGRPDPWTIAAMKGVVASLRGVGATPQSQPHDLVEETIGDGVPILTIAVVLALVLALLALSSRRGRGQDSAATEDTGPAASGES
jgi:peptidoglycan hydrolase-like protein with peptidoglycan-binding domain